MNKKAATAESGKAVIRLAVVDDHPIVALGIELALRAVDDVELVGVAASPNEATDLVAAYPLDVLVLDLAFAGHVRLDYVRQARTVFPDATIVVFTSLPARLYRREAVGAGADAYLTKDHDVSDLLVLVRKLCSASNAPERLRREQTLGDDHSGSPEKGRSLVEDSLRMTPRELDLAEMLSRGLPLSHIASIIGISSNTVAAHRDNLRRKLGCRDSTELVARLARIYARREEES